MVEKPVIYVQRKKKVQFDQNLYAKINSKWILDFDTVRLLEDDEEVTT